MTSDGGSGTSTTSDEMAEVLGRVQQVDPNADELAVCGYVREMSEASAHLDAVDLSDVPLQIAFSAWWPEGSGS
jgi:hypothetical protein